MGTRSTISILREDGSVTCCHCKWDGFIYNNGVILLCHYGDRNKVKDLLSIGAINSLKPHLHAPLDDPDNLDITTYLGEKGKNDFPAHEFKDFKEYAKKAPLEGLDYIFNEKKEKWYFFDYENDKLKTLRSLVLKVEDEIRDHYRGDLLVYEKQRKVEKEYKLLQKTLGKNDPTKKRNKI